MCKTPGKNGECKMEDEDIPDEDEFVTSAEESDVSSGHSYMSDSSAGDWTDSDGESASGHRVTRSMLMYHLMKEKGLITEEKYRSLQKSPEDADLGKVAPRIVSGFDDSDDDDSYSFGTGGCDDDGSNDDDSNGSGNETESEANTKSPEKVDKNNEQNHEVIGDCVKTSEKLNPKMFDATQITESKVSDETIDRGGQGDTINDTGDSQKVNLGVVKMETEAVENKPDTSKAPLPAKEDIFAEETEETNNINVETEVTTDESEEDEDLEPEYTNGFEGKRIESIEHILKEMMDQERIQEEHIMVLETYSSDLDKFYDCNRNTKNFRARNETLRKFALFLNYYSPSAYNYIRETFVTPLPSHKVLYSWYMKDGVKPGLTKKAFDILKHKASGNKLYCTLMSDAVYLTNIGLNYDQVDFGGGSNYKYTDKAIMVFMLMLVGLEEDWKIPIGYFLAREMPAETHAAFIKMCLTQCHQIGVDVVAVTLETPTAAEHLGCNFDDVRNLKTTFKHPECDRQVAVWIEPCLAIRSIYHMLKNKSLIYFDDMKIRYNMIRRFKRLYADDRLNYEESSHLELRNHLAKVGLTTFTLSDSLRQAISLCEEIFPRMFKNSSGTTQFIGAINNLYEILNSKLSLYSGYQRAMDANSKDQLDILDATKGYFVDIFRDPKNGLSMYDKDNHKQDGVYRTFIAGKPICGFVVYLVCIESLKHLFDTLVKTGEVSRLATHRLCKDHIEDFIKHMRRNEDVDVQDFTAWNYQAYLSAYLYELNEKPRLSDRNMALYYPVETKCSPIAEIKVTSGKRAYDEDYSYSYRPSKLPKTSHEDRATKIVRSMSLALDTEGDVSNRKHMVAYLAGWIAAKFAKCLKCEECIDCLVSDKKLWFHKFITLEELRGICLPSEELFKVCWECERVLRSGVPLPQSKILRGLLPRFPWARRGIHHPLHYVHLVRAIVAKYISLRMAVPLSNKETVRMMQMFSLIKCMNMAGLIQQNGMEDL